MPQLVEMDRHVTLFEQMEQRVGPVILINTFTVEPKEADRLQEALASDAAFMKRQPGFISTQLHRGIGGQLRVLQLRGVGVGGGLQAGVRQPRVPGQDAGLPAERGGVAAPGGEGGGARHLRGLSRMVNAT